jgi:hypothetical protein
MPYPYRNDPPNKKRYLYCFDKNKIIDDGRGYIFQTQPDSNNPYIAHYSYTDSWDCMKNCPLPVNMSAEEQQKYNKCTMDCKNARPPTCPAGSIGGTYAYGQCIDCNYPGSNNAPFCMGGNKTNQDIVNYCQATLKGTTQNIIRPFIKPV